MKKNDNTSMLAAVSLLILAIAGLVYTVLQNNKAVVLIQVSPSSAEVKIDGKPVSVNQSKPTIRVSEGVKTFEITKEGFEDYKIEKDIEKDSEIEIFASLRPLTDDALQLLSTDYESNAREEIEGKIQARKTVDSEFVRASDVLPTASRQYRIDTGVSKQDNGADFAIYITADEPEYYEWAFSWLKRQGIDPTNYEYVFRTFEDLNR
jgi:hypothetical protein